MLAVRPANFQGEAMNYLEDFQVNQRIPFGRYAVTQAEIIQFANQYDPQAFHVDESHKVTMELGGLLPAVGTLRRSLCGLQLMRILAKRRC